jgi:type I restriction enzyme S subunit
MAKLGEVCKVSASTKMIDKSKAWLLNLDMVEQQTGRVVEYNFVGEDGLNGSITQFDTENVLYSKLRPNLNKVVLPERDGFCTSELLPLRPDARKLDRSYLAVFLRSDGFVNWAVSKTAGAKMPRLGTKDLLNANIPLPEIKEQKAIAEKFKKSEELISLRKQQLVKMDELVKARFFEMFGEISDNSMNWDCFTIGKLISTIESGWSGNGKQCEKHADEIAVLKVSAVTKGYFIPTECKVLDDQHNIKKYVYPQKGDILFSRANTKEMVGATVLIKKDYPDLILPDKLWKIRFCTDVNPIYMKHVLSTTTVRNAFSAASTGTSGSMYNVSMEKFKGVIIPVPPLSVQNEFAAFVERVDQQKQTVQQSLEKLELMKKALMQEYFG